MTLNDLVYWVGVISTAALISIVVIMLIALWRK
jgi:hypothetical protein